jgi:hypothetical protein
VVSGAWRPHRRPMAATCALRFLLPKPAAAPSHKKEGAMPPNGMRPCSVAVVAARSAISGGPAPIGVDDAHRDRPRPAVGHDRHGRASPAWVRPRPIDQFTVTTAPLFCTWDPVRRLESRFRGWRLEEGSPRGRPGRSTGSGPPGRGRHGRCRNAAPLHLRRPERGIPG